MESDGIERVLRESADAFLTTVAVLADELGVPAYDVAHKALADSLARLQESGVLGTGVDDDA